MSSGNFLAGRGKKLDMPVQPRYIVFVETQETNLVPWKRCDYVREKIIQSAVKQIGRYGFRKFTMDDIAADLGISKKTVYKYFESKQQMISAVVDTRLEMEKNRILKAVETEGGFLDKLNAAIFFFDQTETPQQILEELQRYFPDEWQKSEAIGKFKGEHFRRLLLQGIQNGEVRPDVRLPIIDLAMRKTIPALLDYQFLNQNNITVNQAIEEFKKIILHGILKREYVGEACADHEKQVEDMDDSPGGGSCPGPV